MRCPNCNSTSRMIRTKNINEYLRNISHVCRNGACQMVFVTQQEFIRIVEPPKNSPKAVHPK